MQDDETEVAEEEVDYTGQTGQAAAKLHTLEQQVCDVADSKVCTGFIRGE